MFLVKVLESLLLHCHLNLNLLGLILITLYHFRIAIVRVDFWIVIHNILNPMEKSGQLLFQIQEQKVMMKFAIIPVHLIQ